MEATGIYHEALAYALYQAGAKVSVINPAQVHYYARAEREWEWIEKAPHVRMLKEPQRRVRWLTREEADRLLLELPKHLAQMMRFTLATGLRATNVSRLEWSQVDMARHCAWIHPDQAKASKAIPVPLNVEAIAVLKEQEDMHPDYVFVFKGKPVTQPNNHAWRKALIRASIENFRWHDFDSVATSVLF